MPVVLQTILYILVMIAILGVLISIHEAGHLVAAKAFHVYCFEYAIGFGPKIFRKRRKGGETYFSLRAIPLGGFVSMYSEPGEFPEGEQAPEDDRALNRIHKGKKAVILSAGVVMNFLLGLILIFISNVAFPDYYIAYGGEVTTSQKETLTVPSVPLLLNGEIRSYVESEKANGLQVEDYHLAIPQITVENTACYVVDSSVSLFSAEGNRYGGDYCAIYYPTTLTKERDLASSIAIYPVAEDLDVSPLHSEAGITAYPDFKGEAFSFNQKGMKANVTLRLFAPTREDQQINDQRFFNQSILVETVFEFDGKSLTSPEARVMVISSYHGWNEAWALWAKDVPQACGAIVQGFASLFSPGGFQNLSGIVGMTSALPQIEALGGVGYIFYFAGLLSINLAFFNLLPFPGLDGWQLAVTAVEAITRKKVPAKAQGIASLIGFVLLGILMVAVTVKDIIALIP
ncbi:MAG: RIP metalloprotease RseP [Candidatus Enteromonas sp.]|nr:RIP metalloprotease RseP [Candidatus Enteromonas sp.]MDY6094233.1 RIP metalloprotease RseP [Candidatus Enteromonas sp.]